MILIPADLCCRKTTAPGLAGAEEEVDDPDTEPEVSSSEEEYDTAPNPDNGEHWCSPIPEEQSLNPVAAELWLRQDETNVQNTITGVARSMTGRLAFSSVYHCLATAHSVSPFTPPIGGDQFCQSSLGGAKEEVGPSKDWGVVTLSRLSPTAQQRVVAPHRGHAGIGAHCLVSFFLFARRPFMF